MVQVLNSITSTIGSIGPVEDSIKPFTFIEFITKTDSPNSESVFLTEYKEYLTNWASIKNNTAEIIHTKDLIREQVISLLKTLTVSFTNQEEQRFLSSLDWDFNKMDDPDKRQAAKDSIYSALPLFVSRIKEIALFYKDKRTEATFTVSRNKIRGTKKSIEKIIFDKILSFLFSNNSDKINYVQNYLNVTINNYVDVYSEYFDIDRSITETVDYNNIDPKIYFELESILADMIFDGYVYLREIPLIATLAVDLSQECVGDMLTLKNQLIESNTLSLIDDNEKIALRKRLYEKYIGTDFYYLYKDGDKIVSDIFIKAENPTNNLLNQQTVDTPYTVSKQLKLLKDIGLFFKPDKLSLLRIDTSNFSYSVNHDKVEEGKLYIFPDPKLYGNVSFNRQAEYPFILEYSYDSYIKNTIFGKSAGDPLVQSDAQALYAYYSREQDTSKFNANKVISAEFSDIFNRGFIAQFKLDLYGNKFALYKNSEKFKNGWYYNPNHPDLPTEMSGNVVEIKTDDGYIKHYYDCAPDYRTQTVTPTSLNEHGVAKYSPSKNAKELTRNEIRQISGTLYVYNSTLQCTRQISEVMPWLSSENPRIKLILDNLVSFDIIENTLFLKAIDGTGKIYYLFDGISFNEKTGLFERAFPRNEIIIFDSINPQCPAFNDKTFSMFNSDFYPINGNIYNKVSEPIYVESLHKCYFVCMTLDMVTGDNGLSYPIICPEFYEINLNKLSVKRYFFYKTNGQNKQQIESFSIPDTLLNTATVLVYKTSTPSLAFSEDSLSFMLVYSAYDISNCLYVFKHFLKLSESASDTDGEIDTNFLDSTIYQPGYSGQVTIIPPSDSTDGPNSDNSNGSITGPDVGNNNFDAINLAFVTNNIIN